MSTDIQTGKISPLVSSVTTSRPQQHGQPTASPTARGTGQTGAADTVSMTEQAARLKHFEAVLAEMPQVNTKLVAEMKQAIADGSLDMDYAGTAARLIEMESARSDSAKG